MSLGLIGQAVALFALTNIDDIIVLSVFFGQSSGRWAASESSSASTSALPASSPPPSSAP